MTMTTTTTMTMRRWALVAALVALGACVDAGEPEVGDQPLAEEVLADQVWEWSRYQPPVDLGPATGRTCYLQGLAGHFNGHGEKVYVYTAGGRWWLYGEAQTPVWEGLYAAARCVDIAGEVDLPPGDLRPAASHACFLTRMEGDFDGASEWVDVTVAAGGMWRFTAGGGVGGRAGCVPRAAGAFYWNQAGQTSVMKPTSRVCTLNHVQGELDTLDKGTLIYPSQSNGGGDWLITNWSTGNLLTGAGCFLRNPPIAL